MYMAEISIMTMAFADELVKGELGDVAMLRALESMGYDGVELHAERIRSNGRLLHSYRNYLRDSRLGVTCLDVGCNLVGPGPQSRQQGIDDLFAGVDLAWELGCGLALAAGSRLSTGIAPEEGRKMVAAGLSACAEHARAAGVTLAIENFGIAPTLQCAAADCLEILDAVPGLTFVFDVGNFYFAGEDPLDNIDRLGPRTRHVHLKDWVRTDHPQLADVKGCLLGEGVIDGRRAVRRFLESGLATSFSIEVGAPGDPLIAARADFDTARRWID